MFVVRRTWWVEAWVAESRNVNYAIEELSESDVIVLTPHREAPGVERRDGMKEWQ